MDLFLDQQTLDFYKQLYSKNSRLNSLSRTKLVCPAVLANELHEVALKLTVPEVNILAALENKLNTTDEYNNIEQNESLTLNECFVTTTPKRLCMTQLAELLGFSKATISVAVERLVKKGLVERYFLNNNRKTTYVRLTSLGKELGQNEDNIHATYLMSQLNRHASKEQIASLNLAYDTIIDLLLKFDNKK